MYSQYKKKRMFARMMIKKKSIFIVALSEMELFTFYGIAARSLADTSVMKKTPQYMEMADVRRDMVSRSFKVRDTNGFFFKLTIRKITISKNTSIA